MTDSYTEFRVTWQWEGREVMHQSAEDYDEADILLRFLTAREWDSPLKGARIERRECSPWKVHR